MKKSLAVIMSLSMALACAACAGTDNTATTAATTAATTTEATTEAVAETTAEVITEAATEAAETTAPAEEIKVMSYEEYVAAELDTEVIVETYVQAKQGWWENKARFYTQNEDGAFFLYDMPCTEEEYEALAVGTKIRVKGFKSEWKGEIEITDATFEIIDGSYVAEAVDLTDKFGTDELIDYQNQKFSVKGLTVVNRKDDNGNEFPFMYDYNNSGTDGSDLYFNVMLGDTEYAFTVESYLTGAGTEVYEAVKNLKAGDVIDAEGFLYWYAGVNPHITAITVNN